MSVFNEFGLLDYAPKEQKIILGRINQLPQEDIDFVLRQSEPYLMQFLALVLSAGADGALRYIRACGNQSARGLPIDLGQMVEAKFLGGFTGNFLALAKEVSKELKIPFDDYIMVRVKAEIRHLYDNQVVCRIGEREAGKLTVWGCNRQEKTPPGRGTLRRYRYASGVNDFLKEHDFFTVTELRNYLGLSVDYSTGICSYLSTLRTRGSIVVVSKRRPFTYQVMREALACCG